MYVKKRDVKGMYKKARSGQIKNFTGISDDFDVPQNPNLIIDSKNNSIERCVEQILNYLESQQLVSKKSGFL